MLAVVVALVMAVALVPWLPCMPRASLDGSWAMGLHYATTHHWAFGRDIVFTFGPLNQFYTNLYDPVGWGGFLAAWGVVAALFTAGWLELARRAPIPLAVLALGTTLFAFRGGELNCVSQQDSFFYAIGLLTVAVAAFGQGGRAWGLVRVLAGLTAATAVVKVSFLPMAVVSLLVADGLALLARRLPLATLAGLVSFAALFALTQGGLGGVGDYIASGSAVAADYGESMQLPGPLDQVWSYVAAVAVLLSLFAVRAWTARDLRAELFTLYGVVYAWFLVKAGFVRHDMHALTPLGGVAALTSAWLLTGWETGRRLRWGGLALCLALLPPMIWYGARIRGTDLGEFVGDGLPATFRQRLNAARDVLDGDGRAWNTSRLEFARQDLLLRRPLPPIRGSVDVYPSDIGAILANHLDWRPRPVFQSYSVYSAALLERNRAFLRSGRAADHLLFDLAPIDGRFPASQEGALWPDILGDYDPIDFAGGFVVLDRRAQPLTVGFQPIGTATIGWGDGVGLPREGLVWLKADIRKTLAGRIANLVYKCPVVAMEVTDTSGRSGIFRVLPSTIGAGMLVSPLVLRAPDLARLTLADPGLPRAAGLRFLRPDGFSCYSGRVDITLQALILPAGPRPPFRPALAAVTAGRR